MSNKNEVFEYLIDQLRQQVNSNQCEDLAHEVQSLKNQLCDASEQIKELHKDLARATGDVEAYKLACEYRWDTWGNKRDTAAYRVVEPACDHDWYRNCLGSYDEVCVKCGMKR
ncbi:hypothetical protein [Salmonella phage vB_SenS_4FS1]|uniref:Uncharacterized protein n=1 Tax=Salmonella phage vB_SalP_LDDK01 TaxID=3073996 RepID=A0AB39AJD1_9VIRU